MTLHTLGSVASRLVAAVAVVTLTGLVLAVDARAEHDRRLSQLYGDLARATVLVSEAALRPQQALNEFSAHRETILAAINGNEDHFERGYATMRELFSGVRALQVAISPEHTVGTFGELQAALGQANVSAFCADGRGYAVLVAEIGSRGWVALAYDPADALMKARSETGRRVRLSLIERGRTVTVTDDSGESCSPLPDGTVYREAAEAAYGFGKVQRPDGEAAVAFSWIFGTPLTLIAEDLPRDPWRERSILIVGIGLALLVLTQHLLHRSLFHGRRPTTSA